MSHRIFSDQCVPSEIIDTLRQHGHDLVRLREVIPVLAGQPDRKYYGGKLFIVEPHRIRIRQ